MRSFDQRSVNRAPWTLFALAPLLLVPACGADEPASEEPASEEPAPPEPVVAEPSAEPEAAAGEFPGCPASSECLQGCRTRCETEHGPMLDLAALRACAERGDGAQCTTEATNDPARRCFLTCRGLDPASFPLVGGGS